MKKITAFFLLLLPLFVTGLMFISGLIQNANFPVAVAGISISESDQDVIWNQTGTEPYSGDTVQFHAHVLPLNAKNQEIKWESSDSNIVDINDEGKLTVKGYGRVTIKATALGNTSCTATREVDSFDRVIHRVKITNNYDLKYLSPGSMAKPTIETVPSIDHAENVDSITYSFDDGKLNDDYATIDPNTGIITVNDTTTTGQSKVVCEIKTSAEGREQRAEKAEQTINYGPAVDTIAWQNPGDETILDSTYSLFNNLFTAPASKKTDTNPTGTIESTDFIYESQNTDIATVDEYGNVSFKPGKVNEYATFLITYRRNTDLKLSKRIQTTNDNFQQVFFKQSSLDVDFVQDQDIAAIPKDPEEKPLLDWITYPEKATFAEVSIASTDTNVINVINGNGRPQVKLVNPGKCALKIYTTVGDEVISDVCDVNVKPTNKFIKSSDVTTDKNTPFYYPLVNNLNIAKSSLALQSPSFEIVGSTSDAYIDDNNILHFKKYVATPIKINVTLNGTTLPFNVAPYNVTTQQIEPKEFDTIVGQPLQFAGGVKPVMDGKYYQNYFDYDETNGIFIAKRGCDIELELTNSNKIHVIVREDPLYITTSLSSPLYSTPDTEVDFLNTFDPKIFPTTATKSSGAIYEPIFAYTPDNGAKTATIDENTINFSRIGACDVLVDFGYINDVETQEADKLTANYEVRCTFNDGIGKFKVTKDDSLFPALRTVMNQYDKWDVNDTLRIDDVSYSLYEGLQIKSKNNLCNPTLDWVGLRLTGHIELKANPISGTYGSDVIEICSPTYSLFLNVKINPVITDFTITYKNDTWSSDQTVNSYLDSLSLRVTPNIAGLEEAKEIEWSWKLVDKDKKETTGTAKGSSNINLTTDVEGEYKLILSANGQDIKQYTINRKPEDQVKVSLYNSEDGIYASCNSNTKSALIVTDGYVDDNKFFKQFKDKSSVSGGAEISFNDKGNILTISKINENITDAVLTLTNGESESKEIKKVYPIGRDQVSKIKLPGHNILDESDKKGMQKVHVYGNYSYYPGIGEVNYYKVPVVLYDKARKQLGDGQSAEQAKKTKYNALKNLKITVGRNSGYEIDESGDYIKVFFHKNDLYSPQEIYNNAFDAKTGKNVDFQVATKSNEIHADYKFVAVEGTNVWNQEALVKIKKNELKVNAAVLQKNFGLLDQETDENAILNNVSFDMIRTLYGNGYCLNLTKISRERLFNKKESYYFYAFVCMNANICGGDNDVIFSKDTEMALDVGDDLPDEKDRYSNDRYYAYSILHNYTCGLMSKTNHKIFFKNCLFHSTWQQTLFRNGFNGNYSPSYYLENCSFFDSGKFPIWAIKTTPLYFKGDIKLYNFKDREMLRDVGGNDVTSLWPSLLVFARANNMVHNDYKGDEVVNSFMLTLLNQETYFWDFNKNEYVQSERGIQGSAKYLAKYADIKLPIVKGVNASLWGGTNPSFEPGAPGYFDEYDANGKIKLDFLSTLVSQLTRHPKYF